MKRIEILEKVRNGEISLVEADKQLAELYFETFLHTDKEISDETNQQGCCYTDSMDYISGAESGFTSACDWIKEKIFININNIK